MSTCSNTGLCITTVSGELITSFYPKGEDSKFLKNVGNNLQDNIITQETTIWIFTTVKTSNMHCQHLDKWCHYPETESNIANNDTHHLNCWGGGPNILPLCLLAVLDGAKPSIFWMFWKQENKCLHFSTEIITYTQQRDIITSTRNQWIKISHFVTWLSVDKTSSNWMTFVNLSFAFCQ